MNKTANSKLALLNSSFILAIIILVVISTANTMIGGYRAVYVKQELGASATVAGLVGMWWTYGSMVVRFFVGRISAKFGDNRLLTLGSIGYGITLAAAALTTNVTNFTFVVILQAICHPFCYITCNSLLAKATPKGQEGTGTYLFVGIPAAVCSAAGPWIANACIAAQGFDLMFIAAALMMAFCVILSIVLRIVGRRSNTAQETAGETVKASNGENATVLDENGQPYRGFWKYFDKRAIGPVVMQIIGNLAEMAVMMFGMLYANELGVPQCGAIMFTAVSTTELIVTFLLGSVMDRFGMLAVLLPGCLSGICAYMVFLYGGTSTGVWIAAGALYGIAAGCMRPTFNAGMIKAVPANRLSVATSNFALATSIGGGLAGIIIGALIDNVGFGGVWIFSSVMYAVVFVLALFIFRKYLLNKKAAAV